MAGAGGALGLVRGDSFRWFRNWNEDCHTLTNQGPRDNPEDEPLDVVARGAVEDGDESRREGRISMMLGL